MRCGLLGRKLPHSYSPQIHNALGSYQYDLFEVDPEMLDQFFHSSSFTGINVTIPYKKAVIPYCNELSECAKKIGAVNTIVKRPDGSLIGHNTDYFGFSSMLEQSGLCVKNKKVLVLGSGGASATVIAVLKEADAIPVVISRSGENNYNNLSKHSDTAVLVNTTPVGMYPNVGESPVDLTVFPKLEGVLDLVYNPARTQLLLQAEELGLVALNGLWMLVAQAKESAEWFTGSAIDDEMIRTIHNNLRLQMENLILVGMPGSGKSTIGKRLAERLGKKFVDADAEIVKQVGMSIPEIFDTVGEEGFRKAEAEVITQLGKQSGLVIATGGGCVTRSENYPCLHQNGTIVWLQRDLSKLPTDGRPLSQSNSLETMCSLRKPMYQSFSDIEVCNDHTQEETISAILTALDWEV